MKIKRSAARTRAAAKKTTAKRAAGVKAAKPKARKKDPEKLRGRFALDFAAMRDDMLQRAGMARPATRATTGAATGANPALLRLKALTERDQPVPAGRAGAPISAAFANWTPMGPLAVPNGQTYGGARVLISGRVTAIAPHPSRANTIFIGTSRGGVWRTLDGGTTWTALGDNQPSLAIGALAHRHQQSRCAVRRHRRGQCAILQYSLHAEFGARRVPGRRRVAQHRWR